MRASAYTATHHKPPSFRSRSKTRRTGAWAWAAAVTLVVPLIAAAPFDAREAKADIAGGAGVPPANDLYNYALDMYTEVVFGGQTFWVAGVGDEGYGQLYTPWDPDDLYLLQKDWPAGDARYKTAYSATGSNSYNESLLRQKLKAIEDGLTAAERGVLLPFADDLVWTPYSGGAKNVSAKPDTVPRYEYSGDYDYFFVQPLTRRLDVWWSGPYSGHLYDPDREKRVAIMSYGQSDNKWWGANAVAAGIGQCRQTWSNYEYTSEGEAYYPCPVSVDTALSTELPVRPALALDLSKVRAYSPVGSGYNTRSKAGLDPVTKNVAADAKFEKYGFPSSYRGAVKLIMETGELGLELRARPDGLAAGKKIDLFYDNASTGSNMYVSATVTGLNGTFYQKLKRIGDSPRGKVTVDFAGVPEGNYNVELSAEQVNGDKQADFVSPPQVFMVTLDAAGTAVIAQTGDIVLDEAPPSLDGVSLDVAAGTVVLDFSETMGLDWNPRVTVDKEGDPQGAEVAGTWDRSRQVFTVSKQLEAEANYLVTVKGSAAAPIPDLVGNAVAGVMQKQLQTADRDRFSISYAGVKAVGQPPDSARVGARVEVRVIASCWEAEEVFRGTYSRVDRYGNTVLGGVPLVFEGWSYGGEYDLNCYRRYSWTMPQGDVELYSQVVEPGDVELVVEESPGLGGKLSAYYAKPHTIVTLTGSDTSDSRVTGAVLWEATLAPDGSYTKDAELETISFGSRSSAIFAAPLVPAGKVVLVALTGEEKPRNKVVFPGERNVDGVPVSLEPVDPSGWTLEADGFWSTDQHAAGRFVMFEVKASEPNYAVTALGLTRSYESLPFTWTEIQVDNTYKGSVQFYMPAFTSTRDWVDRPVNLSLSLRRVPVALRVSAVVPDKAIWESVSGFRVTGRGLEQVLGRGRDYASFSPEKRDLLSTVTLKHNGKTAYISQATGRWPGFTLNDDGSLTVPLPDHLKEIIGDPVSDVFYLSIGGVEKPVLIYRDYRARVQPYSVLGIAKERDFLSYSVVMGDTVEDLEQHAADEDKQVLMRVAGDVTYDLITGDYNYEPGVNLLHGVFTYDTTEAGTLKIKDDRAGTVTITGGGGKGSFPGSKTTVTNQLTATLAAGTRYRMDQYSDPDASPNFRNVAFSWSKSGDWLYPAGTGMTATINDFKLLDGKYIFGGQLNIGIPGFAENFLDVSIERMTYKVQDGVSVREGVEAKGGVALAGTDEDDMLNYVSILAGNNYQVYINTFPGEQRYLFDLNGNYGVLEGRVLLDLVESQRAGGLVPDAVGLEAYTGGSGAPIVPPYLTFKGGGFYLYNLAKTIDWDNWKLIPPLYVESKLRLGVMELMDVDSTMRIGLDHIGLALEASVGGPEELGMDFLSLSPASASFDVSWAGAADPDNPEFAKVDASGEFSWYLLPWYRKYAGGMSVGVKKNTWPDFAGYLEGDFGIVGFKVPVINLKVGGWSLGDYRVYVSNQEAYASVGLLGKMLRFKLGTTYRPLDPYADVQWDIGIASGDIHLMADRQPQVGDSISGAQPLIDKDGNQIGVIDLGGAWQLVGQFGYGQAQLAPSLGVQPAANSAALGLMAPQAVPMQVPETSYELTPIERDGDHGHLVGVNGLTGDNLEVFYDKDGVAGGGDWVAYQLVWERPTTDPKAAPATKEELADQSVNAMDFSGQTFQNDDGTTEPGSVLVMLNETLSPLWKIAAKDGATTFEASQVETDPLAGLAGAQWDGSAKKLTVQTENLTDPDTGAFKTGQYRLNAVVDAADGSGQTATVATAVPVTSSAPAVLDLAAGLAALPAGLPSGDYTVSAILEESSKDAEGNTVWGPIDDARADGVYSHRNPLDPVSVGSFSDQPAVAPAGDGVLEISWTGAQDADTQYEVKALNPDGSEYLFPTERIPEVDEDGNPVLDADGNQVVTASQPAPAAWSATSGQHQDPATGRYTLRVGNLDPGKAYKIAITPVRTVGEGLQLRGPAWTSEAVGLPMPNPASIALAYRGATEVVDDVTGDSTVFANGDYTMELAFGQAVVWEVKSGQTVLQSGQTAAAREPVEVTVPASAASAANWITVSAKNAAGDWSFREFTSNFSDATPALFVDADVDGCVYVDGNNEFTVTGLTVPGYTVAVRTAGVAEVTADEYGVFSLTADADGVPAAEGARWVTVTVQDAAGNMASQMVQLVGTNDPPATGPGLSRLEADPEPALAGSGAARSVTARVTEKNGIPLPGVDVVFTVPDGLKHVPALGAPVPGPVDVTVPTDLAGVAKIDVTADSPGTRGVTATADGLAITQGSPAVPLFVAPAYFVDAAASQLTIPTAAGGAAKVPNGWDSHTAQAVVVNLEGDLLVDAPVTFEIKESPGSTPYYRYATTDQNGVATIQFASTWEATFKISARVSSQLIAGSPADAEFAWGDPDLMEGTRLSGEWAWADGSSEATVSAYVVNAEGTALSGVDVLFYIPAGVSAGGTSGPATVTDTTDQWGLASVGLSSTAPGSYEVTATIDGQPITRGSPAVAGFLPPPALSGDHDGSVLTIPTAQGGATKLANGLDAHRAEVLVQSAAGVPAPGVDVMFEASYPGAYGEGGTVGTSVISDQNGVATFEFVSLEEAEWSITAAIISSDGDRWLGLSGSPQTAQFAGGAPAGPVPLVPYVNPTNGKAVSGGPSMDQRQQMDKVERAVVADFASGAELGRADLDQIGEFDIALDPPAADGTVLAVWLEGPAGEKGTPALVVVDAVPPSLIVTANDGNPVTGWAPGANFNIEVIDGDGQVIGYGNVGPDWSFEAPTYHAAGVGDLVTVRALDQAGNTVEAVWRLGLPEVQVVPASAAPAGEVGVVGVNFQPGEDVTAVLEPGGALVGSARADQNGGVSFGWSVPATEAPGTLSVALTGTRSGEQTGAFAVSGDPADPAASQLSIPSAAGGAFRLADGLAQHRAQVQVLDVSGAAMPGVNVRFAWSRPDGASGVETARSGADGVAEWAFSSVDEVTYTVSATIDGITVGGAPGTAEFRGHPPATGFGLSRLEAQGGWAPADGASTRSVTAWATDGRGDPLPGASIAFLVPPGTRVGLVDGPASVTVTADGAGRADVSLTSQAAGTYAVNAVVTTQYGSVQITEGAPAAVVFTVPPAPPGTQADPGNSALAIPTAAGGATVRADGVEAHRAEVSLLTAGGVPVAGQEVVLKWSYNGRNGPAAGTATATSAANGVASWDFTAVEDSLWTVEAQVEGAVVPGSPALAEFQGGAPAWRPLQPPQVGPSNGSRAVGTVQVGDVEEAEAGSLQAVALDASGVELGRAQVAGGGGFDVALAPVLADGARFSVRLEGAAGAVSPATQVVVDAVAPWPGTVSPSGGAALSGTGEAAGVAVVVRGSGGVELCRAQVAADLSWTCDLVPDALVGDVVSVEHSDAAGNAASVSWRIGLPGASVVVPQVRVGEQQTATGTNFQPGELVEAVLQPGSVPVGSGNANAAGGAQFQWVIPAGTVLGSHTVELSGALSGTESAQFDVLPALVPPDAAASQLTVPTAVGGLTVLADAVAKHRAVVAVVDAAGAPMPGAVVDFAWSYVDGAGVPRSGTGQATAGSGGVAVWEFSSADEAVWTVSASVGGVAVGGSPKTAEFKGRPPVSGPGLSRLESPAGSAPADGSSQLAVTAWALDAQGRALPGADVVFSIPSGVKAGLVVGPAVVSVAADAAGRAVLSLTAAAAGTYQVTAVVTTVYGSVAVTEGSPASVVFTQPGPGAPLLAPSADPSNGARVSGRAQSGDLPEAAAGRLVAVVADASTGAELARGPVAADGSFEVALSPPAGHGARLSVRLEGVGRSASPAVLVEVDAVPPSPGAMVPSDGTAASGAGEAPGHVVSVLGPGGAELCSAVVGADLSWECDLVPDAAEGDLVAVEHRDAAGNVTRVEWRIGLPRVEVAASSLRPGESQTATGVNFQPGEQVTAVMRSAPVTVGTSSADADGRVEFTWTVPADTEAGVHTVELTGPLSGIQTVEFQVEPAGEPTQPPTEPPPTEPPATEPPPTEPPATEPPPTSGPAQTASTPGPAPTGGQSGSPLPTTGAGAIPGLVGTAVVSVLAGAVLLMAAWRRRRI